MKAIEKLFASSNSLVYPRGMLKINDRIAGNAFFPGGTGLLDVADSPENKPIMILGQDFDCEANYKISLKNGCEDIKKNATWRNLLPLLHRAGIAPRDCFFTNAIMGVRKGDKGTGKSPAFKDKQFIKQCQEFFLYQLEIQKPAAILVLGKHTAEFLSATAEQLSDWQKIKNFTVADEAGSQVKKNVVFNNGLTANVALLTHPSFRPANVHRRSFQGETACAAEVKMIHAIL